MKKNAVQSRASLQKSFDFFSKPLPGISAEKWTELLEHQKRDILVLEIREELLKRVLEECQKIYLQKQSVNLLVDCAYEAWKRIINLNYYKHDPGSDNYDTNVCWMADKEPEICEQDTWNAGKVPLKFVDESPKQVTKKLYEENSSTDTSSRISDYIPQESTIDAILNKLNSSRNFSESVESIPSSMTVENLRKDLPATSYEESPKSQFSLLKTAKKNILPVINLINLPRHLPPKGQTVGIFGEDITETPKKVAMGPFRSDVKHYIGLPPIPLKSFRETYVSRNQLSLADHSKQTLSDPALKKVKNSRNDNKLSFKPSANASEVKRTLEDRKSAYEF